VEIHEGVVIGPRCTIIAHTRGAGRIVIEKDVAIAAGCMIVCGPGQTLTIGEGSVVSAGSTVSHSIPPFTLCGGPRLKAYGRVSVPFTFNTSYQDFKRGLLPIRRGHREQR
jgi:acetyltransferase-like isoleucine patch superfamily enzyme